MPRPAIEIGWEVDGRTGWGLIGLHLALELHRLGHAVSLVDATDSSVDPMLGESLRLLGRRSPRGGEPCVRLSALGNKMKGPDEVDDRHHVGLAVFEDSVILPDARTRLATFDALLAPSAWCREMLGSAGLHCAGMWHQGYDNALFHQGVRRRLDDRFYVFSGGKVEFRKGQDIVVEAFRRFLQTPEGREAVLVTAWQNAWPHTLVGIDASGYVRGVPEVHAGQLDVASWLRSNGIPAARSLNLGHLSQPELASVMRECDVALFPNRAEGATNLVLAECLGSGLPCIASWNTGHREYAGIRHLAPLERQGPVPYSCQLYRGTDGWGESDPEECVARLIACRSAPGATAGKADVQQFAAQWGWHASAASLSTATSDIVQRVRRRRSPVQPSPGSPREITGNAPSPSSAANSSLS